MLWTRGYKVLSSTAREKNLSLFRTAASGDLSNHSVLAESLHREIKRAGTKSFFSISDYFCCLATTAEVRVWVEEENARFVGRFEFRIGEKILVSVVNKKQQAARKRLLNFFIDRSEWIKQDIVQVVSELAGSMYPGPNRHPVDPRSVSTLVFFAFIKWKPWLFVVMCIGVENCWGGITGASVLNRIETLCCVIIICHVIFTLLEWWSRPLNLVKPW